MTSYLKRLFIVKCQCRQISNKRKQDVETITGMDNLGYFVAAPAKGEANCNTSKQ